MTTSNPLNVKKLSADSLIRMIRETEETLNNFPTHKIGNIRYNVEANILSELKAELQQRDDELLNGVTEVEALTTNEQDKSTKIDKLIKVVKTAKNDFYYELNTNTGKYERTTKAHGSYMVSMYGTLISSEYDKVKNTTTQTYKINNL